MATIDKYTELDRMILAKIAAYGEPKEFNSIFLDGNVHRECERMADATNEKGRLADESFRR
ncbi:hypothetical protein ACKZDW_02145 (plasmid) [Ralstonia syzygii subsp. celebesensis]